MAPEDPVIDPSSLTEFRKLRLKDLNLLDMLVNKTVEIAIEKGIDIFLFPQMKENTEWNRN